jgi:protein-S-isoprenylcysteine O-methyltransferase Ste14
VPRSETQGDRPAVRFPPPLVFLGFVLAGPLIDRIAGLPALPGASARLTAGVVILLGGLTVIAMAIGLFRQAGENPKPWTDTSTLVTSGIYKRTRNPMYLGMAIGHLGLALLLASGGALLTLPAAMLVIQLAVIPQEEAYLGRALGADYQAYQQRVRRWL